MWRPLFWRLHRFSEWKELLLIRTMKWMLALVAAGALSLQAQSPNADQDPAGWARGTKAWHYGPIANGGVGVGDRSDFKFFWIGGEVGKPISRVLRAGIFSGQFELAGDVIPFWQSYTPAAHSENLPCISPGGQLTTCTVRVGGGTYTGASLTPVILRWNFATHSKRFQPWFQGAGGLIYTTHKYPPDVLVTHGTPGGTSVWNFSPQGGVGLHYFTKPHQSVDFEINAVHISSASLGDRNPGVNASMQFQVGYSWWK